MLIVTSYFQRTAEVEVRFAMRNQTFLLPLVKGDTGPLLQFSCKDEDGVPIDLLDKDVYFYLKQTGEDDAVNEDHPDCVVTNASGGICTYQFVSGDLSSTGTYFGDLVIDDGSMVETASEAIRFEVRDANR